ncbi:unnamed protein product [Mycena citricolor]|uniref:Roadblock/LAMTOR2 domain-containing protein n=1 Tax=Mycena citricolor TaxID=2018698 RepID=A0AAD2HYA4_9AGAR|nr:unnamed protein product [Mycena citricolor]CAK5284115.1 unnamed protein product [Mycena citricolor]
MGSLDTAATLPPSSSALNKSTTTAPITSTSGGMTPELESTLSLLSSHRSVLGYILVSRGHPVSIIRHSGSVFDGEQGRRYASAIGRIVESVSTGLEEVHGSADADPEDLRFLRIRTKRHEILISPDDRYLLAVLHDPST